MTSRVDMASSPAVHHVSGRLLYIFHHVFLPPKLPQENDYTADCDSMLLRFVEQALDEFKPHVPQQQGQIIESVITAISRLKETRRLDGYVNEAKLKVELSNLDAGGGTLPIYIHCQNAAILMTREQHAIHVETFELSPYNEAVNSTIGRLQRQFPGPCFSMDRATFNQPGMKDTIVQKVTKMSHQPAPGTKTKVKKSRYHHDDDKDAVNPKMVTELFTAFLRPCCTAVIDSLQIVKNTREEVLWLGSGLPWRRSAFWLLIRVTLQLTFRRLSVDERLSDELYKQFMVFFMARILESSLGKLCDECCHIMTAKIARRLRKLELAQRPTWLPYVQRALCKGARTIDENWRNIRSRDSQRYDPLDFQPLSDLHELRSTELPPSLHFSDPDYKIYNLCALETWVDINLDSWLHEHIGDDNTCRQLSKLIHHYHDVASTLYSRNPAAVSAMLLIILELWIACDKSAVYIHPMLADYDPYIPIREFESLVLPYRSQLKRLARAETYFYNRRQRVRYLDFNILQDFGTPSCFSVRYFDQFALHQTLLATIERRAELDRAEKKRELHQKQQRYKDLISQFNQRHCTYSEVVVDSRFNMRESRHRFDCERCALRTEAERIGIDVHEWPLPADPLEAKSTVFELSLPRPFAFWRDATMFLLITVLQGEYTVKERSRAMYRLQTYSGLSDHFTPVNVPQRIGLVSQVKPHESTHRRDRKIIDVNEEDVCVENAMNFAYFDNTAEYYVTGVEVTDKTGISCTYKVPASSLSLQRFLFRPTSQPDGLLPNTVIASQQVCPLDMSLEEYKALCSMPLGYHIQWENILRQLAMPSVVFKKVETCVFILQIIHQAGPATTGSVLRAGHVILDDKRFVMALLAEVEKAANRIKENWESANELCALVFLLQRVLSLSTSGKIQLLCLDHLSNLRAVAFGWTALVRNKASTTHGDNRRNDLTAQTAYLALICVATFNSEDAILEEILEHDSSLSIFIQCCIVIHDRKGLIGAASDGLPLLLLYRWQNLAYRSHQVIVDYIVRQKRASLDHAIRSIWAAYRAGSVWAMSPGGGNHWLVNTMVPKSAGSSAMMVHVNLLTGELLINGRPLARLPLQFEHHEAYKSLFGKTLIEVMPSGVPGMEFSGRRKYMDHTIHLGWEPIQGSEYFDLRVQANKGDRVWEYIPPRLFAGALPDAFVLEYTHWYDVNRGCVEFRPLKEQWNESDSYWRLKQRGEESGSWVLVKGEIRLVDVRSPTAVALSSILKPIEMQTKIHCKLNTRSSVLEIEIPRLRLSFHIQSGHSKIQSRQYRGMLIDPEQHLDTLIGLGNKLVLLHENGDSRMVLIPEGDVVWGEVENGHVSVISGWRQVSNIHVYSVDSQLGCLVDNGSLQSKLMLCYLHAVTSFCIPDPLTHKTGTEQALSILRSASARSFSQLQPENAELLVKIAELTPRRKYNPASERVMQGVTWQDDLGCLAQHDDFREHVLKIFAQHSRMKIFFPDSQFNLPALSGTDTDLLRRARIRSSTFRVPGFGGEDHSSAFDCQYVERGWNIESDKCARFFTLCKIIDQGIPSAHTIDRGSLLFHLWDFLSRANWVHGPNAAVGEIGYDATLMLEPRNFIATNWCSIHNLLCSDTRRPSKQQIMIWLGTLVFSGEIDLTVLEVLASLYVLPSMAALTPPSWQMYQPRMGFEIIEIELKAKIHSTMRHSSHTPESSLVPEPGETTPAFRSRVKRLRDANRAQALHNFLASLRIQWPTPSPSTPNSQGLISFDAYYNVETSMACVNELFSNWYSNKELREYIDRIASVFSIQPVQAFAMPKHRIPNSVRPPYRSSGVPCIDDILSVALGPPPVVDTKPPRLDDLVPTGAGSSSATPRLQELVQLLGAQTKTDYEKWYVEQLQGSTYSLQQLNQTAPTTLPASHMEGLTQYFTDCDTHRRDIYTAMRSRMTFSTVSTAVSDPKSLVSCEILKTLATVHTGPRFSPDLLLQQLTRKRWSRLSGEWKRCFIAYGRSITALQRAKRLLRLSGRPEDLVPELQNPGHTNWDPYDFPESLLLEIENGILIRDVQEQIAHQMRSIQPGNNAVMQLNMGEGKSSVIVPIVAAALADGSSLVRVLVAKPQSQQMFQKLVSKLGGLLGRQVYHLPVSRSLAIDQGGAAEIERICLECAAEGGVLLVQPEHILSLKLMCLECFINGDDTTGNSLLRTLALFRDSSRDVVDESDENFSVKFELIYTLGSQQPLELSPQRWAIIQQLLDLVRRYAPAVKEMFPKAIEIDEQCPGGFPRIRLLQEDGALELFSQIAHHVCESGIDSLPMARQPRATRRAILSYILNPELSQQEAAAVEDESAASFWTESTRDPLLLLRGLLATGVLAFCFSQKRWRVNYGSAHARVPPTKLSVPYRAKDSPAPRAEFSHPDVVIVLTCLSYYYAGLSNDELFLAFQHVIKSDQADIEYQKWVDDAPQLSPVYRQLGGINLQDRHYCFEHIFPSLRFSKSTIDYFLAHIVFPKEMKEFSDKLSASGWDIGEIKRYPTVGFSGTNDSRVTLPLSVTQLDLAEQNHTNALVLNHLLRPENSVAFTPTRDKASSSDAQVLLDLVVRLVPPTRVILDVGAQILELTNLEVAQSWLEMMPDDGQTQAVVYVNDNDELCVVDRNGLVEPLQVSPYGKQLEACLDYRAAVALGAGITKDKLVQACMRMRKLGQGQSVVFCISQEIRTKILSLIERFDESDIVVSDVLRWAISETWVEMQRSIPLWAIQGRRFERQSLTWRTAWGDGFAQMSKDQAEFFLEPEAQSIEERYRPHQDEIAIIADDPINENIQLILDRCREFAQPNISSRYLDEEEERQLAPEIEQERQIQRPGPLEAREHRLQRDVRRFVVKGILDASKGAFLPALTALKATSAAHYLNVAEFPNELLVTSDFSKTVLMPKVPSFSDNYQRPVQWILTSHDRISSRQAEKQATQQTEKLPVKHMVVVSPFEANHLRSDILKSKYVTLHVYAPRQNGSFPSLDQLNLYSIPTNRPNIDSPPSLRIQLNLFAGQLYIDSYGEYREICEYLGVASTVAPEGVTVAADGFIVAGPQRSLAKFTQSPLKFLKVLLSQIRRNGQNIDKTHLGRLVDGKLLFVDDFEESDVTPMEVDGQELD
ncbi:hypothetical protein BJY01DRAFT_250125 [Aspergillus pseudoustus]|uniref:ubiquitinyl hydrolase 1 n=1 Tax=Aspergillus pseudoustus TaxID=1810923 RepID=A0ABR4JJK0_9EURO